jgi:hypothetical protein
MKLDPGYQAYVAALTAAHDLPRVQAAELDAIERRARNEIDALDRSRREAADRWVGLRDNSARLARRVDELAGRVGAPPPLGAAGDLLPPAALRGALHTLSSELDRADQSWQWLLRHQERVATTPPPPPVAPTPAYTPPPQPAPTPSPAKSNTTLLLVIGGAVILVLIVVIIVMAL